VNENQREAMKEYISTLPPVMPDNIRQIRHQIKSMDLDQVIDDVRLLRRLDRIEVPIGRKSNEVKAKFKIGDKK
jgi:hypothetical protein